jgi:DNA-binding NarL/FixJ family response regulator
MTEEVRRMPKTTVIIADDHGIVRAGVRLLLERIPDMQVTGEAADGRQAVALAKQLNPDIVLMDVGMPLLNGLDATAQIVKDNPDAGVIILSMHADESYVLWALDAGAKGYLLKDHADEDIEEAVRAVVLGKTYFSPALTQTLLSDYVRVMRERHVRDSHELLTEREREVLQLLAEGKSNKEAAVVLKLSPFTVETHRTNLMQKLGLHNTAGIVLYAVRKGIIRT